MHPDLALEYIILRDSWMADTLESISARLYFIYLFDQQYTRNCVLAVLWADTATIFHADSIVKRGQLFVHCSFSQHLLSKHSEENVFLQPGSSEGHYRIVSLEPFNWHSA